MSFSSIYLYNLPVGLKDGLPVGSHVGWPLGCKDGLPVGCPEGLPGHTPKLPSNRPGKGILKSLHSHDVDT